MITTGKPGLKLVLICILGVCLAMQGTSLLAQSGDKGKASEGGRIFSRMANSNGETCVDCHYFLELDTINWNPSAMDLASRTQIYANEGIGKYFTSPEGDVMKKAHEGYQLSAEDESGIIAYLADIEGSPPLKAKHIKWRLILFAGMFVLLILLGVEKRRIRRLPKTARMLIRPMVWTVILVIAFQDAVGFNRSKNYEPVQPIKFSHSIHYTDNKIDCNYCHSGVTKGKNAGFPPVSLCMNCHKHQQEGTRTGFFELRKVVQAAEDSIPIRWVRVYNLPDFAYFNHMQHVTVGGVECLTCHGEVEKRHVVRQEEDLSMGWCIDCHDETAVDFSNEYYKLYYPAYLDSLRTGKLDSVMVSDIMGRECAVCHY